MRGPLPSRAEGEAGNGRGKGRKEEELLPVPWKDVLAMILAGFQVLLPSILILGIIVTVVLFAVLALLR